MKALIVSPFKMVAKEEAGMVRKVFRGAEVFIAGALSDTRCQLETNVFEVAIVYVSDNGILGGRDGVQVIKELHGANSDCLIFAISDSLAPRLGAQCRRAGATEYASMAWKRTPVNELLRHNLEIFEAMINPAQKC